MKKILAMLLAVMMLLSVASVAMAEGVTDTPATPTDMTTVTIKKVYKLANAGTTSPAETFTLTQVGAGRVTDGEASSAPALGTITGANFTEGVATVNGTTGDITVALPEYNHVGVYEYTLKEVAGTTAGVTYYGDNITLKVTVINDTEGNLRIAAVHAESENNALEAGKTKKDNFPNTYSAGKLNVTKTVAGNLGDKDKKFGFTVKFTKPAGKEVKSTITATVAGQNVTFTPVWNEAGEYTFTFQLAHDETATFDNLPYGVNYAVTEDTVTGYETTMTGESGTIESVATTAAFTNTKTGSIDTGVMLDSMPYVLVLAVVGAAVIALIAKKRRAED